MTVLDVHGRYPASSFHVTLIKKVMRRCQPGSATCRMPIACQAFLDHVLAVSNGLHYVDITSICISRTLRSVIKIVKAKWSTMARVAPKGTEEALPRIQIMAFNPSASSLLPGDFRYRRLRQAPTSM